MYIKLIFTSMLMILVSGCATIINGNSETITFDSSPSGANVYIDGALVGKTPVSVTLKKNKKDTVMFKLDGHRTVTRELNKSFDAVALLNIFWDLSTTDFITGAAMEYDPKNYYIEMHKEESGS